MALPDASPADLRRARWWALIPLGGLLIVLLGLVLGFQESWLGAVDVAAERGRAPTVVEKGWGLFWQGTVANLGLTVALMLTARWWALPGSVAAPEEESETGGFWRSQGVLILGFLALAVAVRAPRMDLSLYNDEAHNYGRLFSGSWKQTDEGPEFKPAKWGDALFRNTGGNNAQPYSVLAKASLDGAKSLGLAADGEVVEWVVRLPSLAAGLLSLVGIGWLAWKWLGRRGMIFTLLMLVFHPWHIRHSSEARGQSLLLLGVVVMAVGLMWALERGRWRSWLLYGVGLFLCATSFIGCVYFLLALNLVLMLRQIGLWRRGVHGVDQVWRPLVVGVLASMAGLQLMLPILPQLIEILKNNPAFRGAMGLAWWQDILGFAMAGTRWLDQDPLNPESLAITRWAPQLLRWIWLLAWMAALAGGSWLLWRRGGVARLLAVATPLGAVLSWAFASLQGNYLNLWYLYFTVPWIVLALGAGIAGLPRKAEWAGLIALLTAPMWMSWQLRDTPKQHLRWPVEVARGGWTYPKDLRQQAGGQEIITAGFWCNSDLYDGGRMVFLQGPADLEQQIQRARAEDKRLYVTFSHGSQAELNTPELVRLLRDEGLFEKVGTRFGLEEEQFAQHLYRLRPED